MSVGSVCVIRPILPVILEPLCALYLSPYITPLQLKFSPTAQ